MNHDLDSYKKGLNEIVTLTRTAIMSRLSKGFTAESKNDGTLVTEVDKEAETAARNAIERLFPDHAICGEEFGEKKASSEFVWHIDPIDGTQNLRFGVPTFGTVLALYHKDTPLVAAIDHPALNLCYMATKGEGTTKNGVKITIADRKSPKLEKQEIICFSPRYNFIRGKIEHMFDELIKLHPHSRVYYDCFAHSMAAQGSVVFTLDVDLSIWDYAAAALLVVEAGGAFKKIRTYTNDLGVEKSDILIGEKTAVTEYAPVLERLLKGGKL